MKKYFSLILLLFSNIFVFGQAIEVDSSGSVGVNMLPDIWSKFSIKGNTTGHYYSTLIYGGDTSSAVYKATILLQNNTDTSVVTGTGVSLGFAPLSNTGGAYFGLAKISGIRENNTSNNQDTALTFQTRTGSSNSTIDTEKMRISANGNVGIGTTAPLSKLNIHSSTDPEVYLTRDGNSPGNTVSLRLGNNNPGFYNFSPYIRSVQGAGIDVWKLELGTSNTAPATTKMTIDHIGNIGIGTATPLFGFANDRSVTATGSSSATFFVNETGIGSIAQFGVYNGLGYIGTRNNYSFGITSNNVERMRFDINGNIGVGTAAPQNYGGFTTVDVSGASAGQAGRVQVKTFDSSVKGILGAESDKVMIDVATNHPLVIKTNDIERMRVDASGYVGIGVTPTAKLDVAGNAVFTTAQTSGNALTINVDAPSGTPTGLRVAAGISTIGATAPLALIVDSAGSNLLRVQANGNIGMGTSAPTEKLEVNGAVKATSFKVGSTTLNVPDYVFEDNYELKSLEEVHAFIEKNGHLPGISSAKEINANGLDLPEMQLKLLEKVEELTLYSIKQNQEIQKLKKEKDELLETLLKRIENLEKNK